MNLLNLDGVTGVAVLAAAFLFAANFVDAVPKGDAASLERGAVADLSPHQKSRSAIREAGGAYKESQRGCALIATANRPACTRVAKATYDQDMADAKLILN